MKPATAISLLALVISGIALFLAIDGRSREVPQSQLAQQVELALDKRERELVEKLKPRFENVYSDMLEVSEYEKNPETFAELFGPVVTILEHMVDR